jgi:Ca2+-binding RTX toxin-like protein
MATILLGAARTNKIAVGGLIEVIDLHSFPLETSRRTANGFIITAFGQDLGLDATATFTGTANDIRISDSHGNLLLVVRGLHLPLLSFAFGFDTANFNSGNDDIYGSDGGDYIAAGEGDDAASGGLGNDPIRSKGGNDWLSGDDGVDFITGGFGRDILNGGAHRDFFNFDSIHELGRTASTRDVITDFKLREDIIGLGDLDANVKVSGNQAFTFIGNPAFTGKADQLHYVLINKPGTANDLTIVEGDVNGDKVADFQIELIGLKALSKYDFIL